MIVASMAGLRGGGHEAAYAATKFAQAGLAGAVLTVLRQPRRMRTQLWSMWSMSEVG